MRTKLPLYGLSLDLPDLPRLAQDQPVAEPTRRHKHPGNRESVHEFREDDGPGRDDVGAAAADAGEIPALAERDLAQVSLD